ncbi:hypothetical protein LZ31DRAFT_525437 [Colletotrichum somersetense]|nr:hypothetical protein LZ31DRAFT_525437 [Colletotrichum somersetense]
MDPGPLHKRRRPAVACRECRRRKIACDLGNPCGHCKKSPQRCIYNNTGPKDSSSSRSGNNSNTNTNTTSNSNKNDARANCEVPITTRSETNVFNENRPNSEPAFSSTLTRDARTLANVDHGSIFDVLAHLGQPRADLANSFFDDTMLGATASYLSDLDFFSRMGCDQPDKPSSAATVPSFDHQPSLASASSWTNMGFDSASHPQSELSGSLAPWEHAAAPPSLGSSSSSYSSLMSEVDSGPSSGRSVATDNVSVRCEGVRLLLRVFAGQEKEEDVTLQPDHETIHPVMEMFAKLEQFAQQRQHENKAAVLRSASAVPLTGPLVREMLPPRPRCDVLVMAYIRTFESVFRILDVPSFMQEYENFWTRPPSQLASANDPFACKLLLVAALACCVCRDIDSPTEAERVHQEDSAGWVLQAKQWFEQNMLTGRQAHLDMAQILCLLSLTRNTQHQYGASAGAVLFPGYYDPSRIGIKMGLHREPRTRSATVVVAPKDAEMRRRLWATMLELSLQICLDESLPPPLTPETYDCEPPSNIADEDDADQPCAQRSFTNSMILVQLARTQRLRLRILQLLNIPGTVRTYEESHRLAAELSAACGANLETLRALKSQQPQQHQPSDFQINMLDTLTRGFVLALHSRFATLTCNTPAFYFSRQMRMETAVLLLSCDARPPANPARQQEQQASIRNNNLATDPTSSDVRTDAYSVLRIHGHAHFVTVPRQAAATLFLDLISELEENLFPTLHRSSRQQLQGILNTLVGVFERRMRAGSGAHSAREFVLFSAAAAYVDALMGKDGGEGGVVLDEAVARAACGALELCAEVVGLVRRGEETRGEM